jgi:endonuclease/exonuclease/phosphatase family metal-dependent hydrolase
VGPLLVESSEGIPSRSVDRLAVITWNVHVGGGDVETLIDQLKQGRFTAGRPTSDFVLLLQEAHREGGGVPTSLLVDAPSPRPIIEQPPDGVRRDVRSIAGRAGLHVFYAPAMRNSPRGSSVPEDRGLAILSTAPLTDLQVIELPFERQRRIAVAATLEGRSSAGMVWRLRVANVQIDTSLALTRGGPIAARKRQAEALVEALDAPGPAKGELAPPMILGGDFNTWLGAKEPTVDLLLRAFPNTPRMEDRMTWRGPLGAHARLDHLFVRGRFQSVAATRLAQRFGSDHYPLLTLVEFDSIRSTSTSSSVSRIPMWVHPDWREDRKIEAR